MIDWLSVILPVDDIIAGGHCLTLSPDGEVVGSKVLPLSVTGSYTAKVSVCNIAAERFLRGQPLSNSNLQKTFVYINGNPSKYLQGHNVYGSNDLRALASKYFSTIAKELGFGVDVQDRWYQLGITGRYEITRIDLTESFRVGDNNDAVTKWILAAHKTARVSHKNASMVKGDTLYFGQHSSRHTIKIYNKLKELKKHPIDFRIEHYSEEISKDAENLLRVEVTFRAQKLREMEHGMATKINQEVLKQFYYDSIKAIKLSSQLPNFTVNRQDVGRAVYSTYLEWLQGGIPEQTLSHTTFYRHRSALLPYDIDILLPRDTDNPISNVIPLIRVLEAQPAVMPSFYREHFLLAA